jgi:hypothetical protein
MTGFAATASSRGAAADMTQPLFDVAETLARLSALTIFELRGEWRRMHRMAPPMRLSRDLLMRGITYKLQERPFGGLSKSILRKLECLNIGSEASIAKKLPPPISLKAGTRLIREWAALPIPCLSMPMDSNGTADATGPSQSSPIRLLGHIGRVRTSPWTGKTPPENESL